ncbi:MAG: DUF4258 domain-containing protein [Planctomycetes bacterium]|nr:DUF4258 domain-containing protein [Planctomycetota bacterium]
MDGMKANARRALATIRECVELDRVRLRPHFVERMHQRGLFWTDVAAVLDAPADVRDDGTDDFGRPKWIVAGESADRLAVEIVVALDRDDKGRLTIFLTMFYT